MQNFLKRLGYYLITRYSSRENFVDYAKKHFQPLYLFPVNPQSFKYAKDGLFTIHNTDFIKDELFSTSYKLGKETGSWGEVDIEWRAFIACWAADNVKHLSGDFVECGVNRGGLSRAIINYVNFSSLNKKFFLFDTFNGLDDKYISDEEKKKGMKSGGYEECFESVKSTFKNFNVELIRGAVPETLTATKIENICYLSIDMNCVEPEISAARFFWDKIVTGGIILLDDYGWYGHEEQKKAFDIFARERGRKVLALPTGQGMIIK